MGEAQVNSQAAKFLESLAVESSATRFNDNCSNCRLGAFCLPLALRHRELDELERIVQRSQPLQRGQHLFWERDEFQAVYAVRSGSLKAYQTSHEGHEQVTGFYFPGEILGFDGIGTNFHVSSAQALETASVCTIPFDAFEDLSQEMPHLQRHLMQLMSREIAEDHQLIALLSKATAEQRMSAFLIGLSSRRGRENLSATKFRLSMSRIEISNYLGLTVETVSRILSRLHKQKILKVDKREIEILQKDVLKETAGF